MRNRLDKNGKKKLRGTSGRPRFQVRAASKLIIRLEKPTLGAHHLDADGSWVGLISPTLSRGLVVYSMSGDPGGGRYSLNLV